MKTYFFSLFMTAVLIVSLGATASAQMPPPPNYGQSPNWLEKAASSGDASSQYLLARKLEEDGGGAC